MAAANSLIVRNFFSEFPKTLPIDKILLTRERRSSWY